MANAAERVSGTQKWLRTIGSPAQWQAAGPSSGQFTVGPIPRLQFLDMMEGSQPEPPWPFHNEWACAWGSWKCYSRAGTGNLGHHGLRAGGQLARVVGSDNALVPLSSPLGRSPVTLL